MALSPNYGWAEPDNSSLVKNGAQDIRALGDAIDTSVWNIGFGQAGKNKIINGDFRINQRNFTSTTTDSTYGFDRWRFVYNGGTTTYSTQSFTLGSAPVAGYEGTNYARLVTTGQSAASDRVFFSQRIESVRTFAGQTATFSFWAKAATGTPKMNIIAFQSFGTGGSPSASVSTISTAQTISTSWVRYSFTIAVPSISGKTLGTAGDDHLALSIYLSDGGNFSTGVGAQNNTFDIWGVQAEYGSKATPFQTASGNSIQGELAMCQRYYYRATDSSTADSLGVWGIATSATAMLGSVRLPVDMRVKASAVDYANLRVYDGAGVATVTSLSLSNPSPQVGQISVGVASGLVATNPYFIVGNTGNGYLGFSAEL
jgi:hypothetical protein